MFTGLGGQAPEGFLLRCSGSDNLTVPTDNISYAEDNQCADGSGAVNLDASQNQFTWFGSGQLDLLFRNLLLHLIVDQKINYFTHQTL